VSSKGLERAKLKCDSCGVPVSMLLSVKVVDDLSGSLVDELWCKRCLLDKGERARQQQENGR
jgi:hypothetical protein